MDKNEGDLRTFSYHFYARGVQGETDEMFMEKIQCSQVLPFSKSGDVRLVFVVSGTGVIRVNGICKPFEAGMLARLFPYHISQIEAKPGQSLELIQCCLPLSVLMYLDLHKRFAQVCDSVVETGDFLVCPAKEEQADLQKAFENMLREHQGKQPFYIHMILGELFRIMTWYERRAQKERQEQGPAERTLAFEILQYIHLYFNRRGMDAALVAEHFHVTPLQLGHTLRTLTGQGFAENLHQVRLRNARAMMCFEELSIAFIARYVGYASLATFYRVFKKQLGITPEEYRRGVVSAPVGAHRDTAWKILLYLLENYQEDLKPARVAEELFMGEDTLLHICQCNFQKSFCELLEQIRLAYACALLGTSRIQVYDAAMAVGYNSVRTFSRSFANHLGTTPQKYRMQMQRQT